MFTNILRNFDISNFLNMKMFRAKYILLWVVIRVLMHNVVSNCQISEPYLISKCSFPPICDGITNSPNK